MVQAEHTKEAHITNKPGKNACLTSYALPRSNNLQLLNPNIPKIDRRPGMFALKTNIPMQPEGGHWVA
jgi:hypothetical protein